MCYFNKEKVLYCVNYWDCGRDVERGGREYLYLSYFESLVLVLLVKAYCDIFLLKIWFNNWFRQ